MADAKEIKKRRNNERKKEPGFSSIPLTPRKHKNITAKANIELKDERRNMDRETSPVIFTGRCPCGERLSLAYNRDLGKVFFNCFRCFPMFERVKDFSKLKNLDKETRSRIKRILKGTRSENNGAMADAGKSMEGYQ